jgi:hypothetical protein
MYKTKYNTPEYRKKYTGIYGSWYAMKQRCGNPNHKQYKDYGGRGITHPEKWNSFEGFKEDMGSSFKEGLTIDRIDNNEGYSVENCRWINHKAQNGNKRCNIIIEYAGQKKTLLEWWKFLEMNISYGTLRSRYYRGMTIEQILETNLFRPWKI